MVDMQMAVSTVAAPATVLLVDDDQDPNGLVARFLEKSNFRMLSKSDSAQVVKRVEQGQPQLVILNVMLPRADGLSICRDLRIFFTGLVLKLSALGDDVDQVVGLETGTDDYLAKLVRQRVLKAHVQALLHRHQATVTSTESDRIEIGYLVVDARTREVHLNEQSIRMSGADLDLLRVLAQTAGQVLSRDTIYKHLSGRRYDGVDRMVDLRISRLRKKLGGDPKNPSPIKSVRSVGYLLAR